MKPEDFARLNNLYQKLATGPLGMATRWESRPNGSPKAKPLLYGGRRGLIAYGTIATWDEFALIAETMNAFPQILATLESWSIVEQLRAGEGAAIEICCDNPDFNGQPNSVVVVYDDWTDWQEQRFTGDTVLECLRAALAARETSK